MKKLLIILLVFLLIGGGILWHFRFDIFQFSADSIIRKLLPSYIHVDEMIFDLKNGVLWVKGFSIQNPKGFQNRYLATIGEITCSYRMQGKNILDGIEITSIEAQDPVVHVERLRDGRINLNEMGKVMAEEKPKEIKEPVKESLPQEKGKRSLSKIGGRKISDIIKLTDTVNFKSGKFSLIDKAVARSPFYLTFEDISGVITISLNSDYTGVTEAGTRGEGFINGDRSQKVSWRISMDPNTPSLTMSNRVEPENVDIMLFKPYYDQYSPIDIRAGRFSGSLVFDFDNGNIGSTNTIRIRGLRFAEKEGGFASGFWDTSVSDVIKYLQTSSGEIVFDFKIKGTMQNPRFFPGPYVQQAIQRMAVDKISQMIQQTQGGGDTAPTGGAAGGAVAGGGQQTDAQKVMGIIQGLMEQ